MAIGPIAGQGLYDEHQKAGDSRKKSHLGQGQPQVFHKYGIQRVDERAVEITAEVHQADGDENFPMGFYSGIDHRGFWHLPWSESIEKVDMF